MSTLVEYLTNIKEREDRGKLADIRCALKNDLKHKAWPFLALFGGIDKNHKAKVVQTVAGLYAYHHPTKGDSWSFTEYHNLGDVCYSLLSDDERKDLYGNGKNIGPLTKRFQYLLAAKKDEVCDRVVKLVLYAKSKGVSVEYERLYKDLLYWDESIRIRWAKSFWKVSRENEQDGDK